jgi:putative ABC transport system ATP-binding protein
VAQGPRLTAAAPAAPGSATPLVALRGVSKAFDEGGHRRVVFDGLDAAFDSGRFTAITGRSGSGKSTLLNLLSGIELPDAGEVLVGGVAINRLADRERTLHRRRHVGFVFQFFNLVPTLTVEENLLLPLDLLGVPPAQAGGRARALLARVGLAQRAGSFPDRLSGGEQQRVAIARALVHGPGLILADEPTGNLDAETGREVLDLLCGVASEGASTLLMVTHSQEAAARAARVLLLRDGRLAETDSPRS